MARYEALRDRLPLLYRPDADDAVQPVLPLGRDDLVEVGGDTDPIRFKATPRGDGSLIVELSAPGARFDGSRSRRAGRPARGSRSRSARSRAAARSR